MVNQTPRVYSYLRFSDPKQAAGGSADRQLQYAQRWAEANGLPLDTSLTMRDEGLSAYHQRHVSRGALGAFLAGIDEGRVVPGSVLIVEGLDRLSRAEPVLAQAQLAQIINAGVTVVTASDNREYNRASLKAQPMDLVYSLLVMIRAHEESDTKSKRVKAAIVRQCQRWIDGSWRGVIRNGTDPSWVRREGDHFELIPERVEALRRIITLRMEGWGFERAIERLQRDGIDTNHLPASRVSLYRTFRNPALAGRRVFEVDGARYVLDGYYPPIMTMEEFESISALADISGKTRATGKSTVPSIFGGQSGILRCGYCGHAMTSSVQGTRAVGRRKEEMESYRRITCSAGRHRCTEAPSCSVVPIESAVLTYCSDQMHLDALQGQTDTLAPLRAATGEARKRVADLERQLNRITDALLAAEGDGAAPLSFVRRAREIEAELKTARQTEESAERALHGAMRADAPARADAWAALTEQVLALDYDARMKARKLIAETFERVIVYAKGTTPSKQRTAIDILLISRGGVVRELRVLRKSGALVRGEEITLENT